MFANLIEFKNLADILKQFPDEQSCINNLTALRWNGVIVSPFDPTSKVYKCAGNKYRCKSTKKYFNVRTGTIFENTKIQLQKWFMAIYLINSHKKGISSHQLARDIGVTQKTSWFMLHRIRYGFDHKNFKKTYEGIVEADETFVGGLEGNKHSNKRRRGSQGGAGKIIVLGILERGGQVRTFVIPDRNSLHLHPIINSLVKPGSTVYTDELRSYRGLKGYKHGHVMHAGGEYVRGEIHINGIENCWSILKRGILGIYHHTSAHHLQQYLNEFSFRFNTRKMKDNERFNYYLTSIEKRLTYKQLTSRANAA